MSEIITLGVARAVAPTSLTSGSSRGYFMPDACLWEEGCNFFDKFLFLIKFLF